LIEFALAAKFSDRMANVFSICKRIFFDISNFVIIEKMASACTAALALLLLLLPLRVELYKKQSELYFKGNFRRSSILDVVVKCSRRWGQAAQVLLGWSKNYRLELI
jgi:hypothetical protein